MWLEDFSDELRAVQITLIYFQQKSGLQNHSLLLSYAVLCLHVLIQCTDQTAQMKMASQNQRKTKNLIQG